MALSGRAVVAGAAIPAVIVVAAVVAVRLISAGSGSNVNLLVVLALLVGFPVGGVVAYRLAGLRPLAHAATAAGLAWLLIGAAVVTRGLTLARVVTFVLLVQVTTGAALLGAWVSYRRRTVGRVTP